MSLGGLLWGGAVDYVVDLDSPTDGLVFAQRQEKRAQTRSVMTLDTAAPCACARALSKEKSDPSVILTQS